jgi:CMP/dCMP kinase
MDTRLFSITISHQIGSGGAYLGKKLAERLGIPFLDRDILKEVARQLDLAENELEDREERLSTFWQNFTRLAILTDPYMSIEKQWYLPSDERLFETERATIQRIANEYSAIFLGRCSWYVLRDHPRHVRLLVTANQPFRVKRLCDLFKLSEVEAEDRIKANDQEREDYIRTFTKQYWLDARHYDLCMDTSEVGLDTAVDLAEKCVRVKLQMPVL